jgi:outer membrane lipoprotein SlyB
MNKFLLSAAFMTAIGLSACASDTGTAGAYEKAAADRDAETITGSRLPRPTTERIVKSVGNKDFKDEQIKSIHNEGNKPGS